MMKKLLVILFATVSIVACKEKNELKFETNPSSVSIAAEGGTVIVDITSSDAWTATEDLDWITLSKDRGVGGVDSITISATPSSETISKAGVITFLCGGKTFELPVSQGQMAPEIRLNVPMVNFDAMGGDQKLTVKSNTAWEVEADTMFVFSQTEGQVGTTEVTISVGVEYARHIINSEIRFKGIDNEAMARIDATKSRAYNRYTDSLTLVDFYSATDGASWKTDDENPYKYKWNLETPINEWYGILLNEEGRVDSIKFTTKAIQTPSEIISNIGDLNELMMLDLGGNNITGTIPMSVNTLKKLNHLDLGANNLLGGLNNITNLVNLRYIFLGSNSNLEGELPSEIANMRNLEYVQMAMTKISGSIPAGLSNLTKLTDFMIFKAQLTGTIPDAFTSMSNLKMVMLYGNQLTGELPASLGYVVTTQKSLGIQLQDNNLTGGIPDAWVNLAAVCNTLRVSGNRLEGVVPEGMLSHPMYSKWKVESYMLPQQEGYGLTLPEVE